MPITVAVTTCLLLLLIGQTSVSAISCYNYHLPAGRDPTEPGVQGIESVIRNCNNDYPGQINQFGVQPFGAINSGFGYRGGACVRAQFLELNSEEVITGYCTAACPAIFREQPCLYPDGGAISRMIVEMTGIQNAQAVCCCETDLCNGARRSSVAALSIVVVVIVLLTTALNQWLP